MRIAVTGPTGTIGTEIVNLALESGYEVIAIVRPGSDRISNLRDNSHLKIIECNISDYITLEGKEQCDAFIHLAWMKTTNGKRDDVYSQNDNITYCLDAVRLASSWGAKAFIGAGSQAEYGNSDEDLSPSTPINPTSGYGIAKYAAGRLSKMYCSQLGIRFCWVRILSVFGINDLKTTLISYLLDCFTKNVPPELTKCEQVWDYLYAKDAAKALILLCTKGVDGKTYVLGSGTRRLLKDYVLAMKEVTESHAEPVFGVKPYYPHQAMRLCADISELTKDTGFVPEYTFEDGIRDILSHRVR